MSKFITTGAIVFFTIGMALPALAAEVVNYPRITVHATSTATSTNPGVHIMSMSHAKKPVFKTLQGVAKSVSMHSLTLTVRKTDYTVTASSTTRIVNRTWHAIALSDIRVGDRVRVFGVASSTSISAQIIRDISLPKRMGTTTVTYVPRIRYKDGLSTN